MEILFAVVAIVIYAVFWIFGGFFIKAIGGTSSSASIPVLFFSTIIIFIFCILFPSLIIVGMFQRSSLNPSGMLIEPDNYKIGSGVSFYGLENKFVIRVSKDVMNDDIFEYWAKHGFSDGRKVSTKHMKYDSNGCYKLYGNPEYTNKTVPTPNMFYIDPDYPNEYVCAQAYDYEVPYDVWNRNPKHISVTQIYSNGEEKLIFLYENDEVVIDER
jgi:hypothetical protein